MPWVASKFQSSVWPLWPCALGLKLDRLTLGGVELEGQLRGIVGILGVHHSPNLYDHIRTWRHPGFVNVGSLVVICDGAVAAA